MTHVLIVEDHEENRDLLKLLLQANGYQVTAAGDGIEALACARRDPPDAIVSDALMPRMDGFALCRAWHADAALKAIPFIFYSATYVHPDDGKFALALGAVRYLIKPLEGEVFLRELRAVLQQWAGRAAPSPAAPLDAAASHVMHESVLARKIEDKMEQVEAAKRKLQESEARFRKLTEMSSDFYWETDAGHRLTDRTSAYKISGVASVFKRAAQIGEHRWDIPYLSPEASGWAAHRATLDARRPFREFEFSRVGTDGAEHFISISGDPLFDASGAFTGYHGVGTDITERKQTEAVLRESERRYRSLFENMTVGYAYCQMLFEDGRPQDFVYVVVNDAFQSLTGLKNVAGKKVTEVVPGIRQADPELFERYARVALTGRPERFEIYVAAMKMWFDISVYCPKKEHFVAVFDVITARKTAEFRIGHLTRLYATLSHTNTAIVRARNEDELFDQICRIAIEHGKMLGAVVRIADAEANILRAAAYSESMRTIVDGVMPSIDPSSSQSRPISAMSYLEDRVVIFNEFDADDSAPPWQKISRAMGARSVAALPIRRGGKPIGVFAMNSAEPNFFDPEMLALLQEMSTDISYVLDNFAYERRRKRAEQGLAESEERFRSLVEQSLTGICIVEDGRFTYVNPRLAEIYGYAPQEMVGMQVVDTIAEEDQAVFRENIRKRLSGETKSVAYTHTARRKDGSTVRVGVNGAVATMEGRPIIVTMLQDISEREQAQLRIEAYVKQLEDAMLGTVTAVSTMVELRDPYTAGHERRVGVLARAIGAEMNLAKEICRGLEHIGRLHDLGKISVPAEILSKPSSLSTLEFSIIKAHCQAGYDILKDVSFPWPVAMAVLQHHERLDGSGYPNGTTGNDIILEARILAVADVVEAMGSHRPYRATLGLDAALDEVVKYRGLRYDEYVVDACVRLFREKGFLLPE